MSYLISRVLEYRQTLFDYFFSYVKFSDKTPATVQLAAAKSRTLEPLAFDEYCRFDTSAVF
jgi:hypothetical protein